MLTGNAMQMKSTKVSLPVSRTRFQHYSFGIPAFKLSYLLNGYSKQFKLFSMLFPSYPPSPCADMLIRLSELFAGLSPEVSHHIAPPR